MRKLAGTARMFQKGFAYRSLPELALLLEHSDQRVRQASQFAMVGKGGAIGVFSELTKGEAKSEYACACPLGLANCIVRG